MRRLRFYPLFSLVFSFFLNVSAALASTPDVIKASRHDTSPALSQVISASGTVAVTFSVKAVLDDTKKPKVADIAVPNALVKIFSTGNAFQQFLHTPVKPEACPGHLDVWPRVVYET